MQTLKRTSCGLWISTVLCWGLYFAIGSTVEADGTLREPFVLIPIGWLLLFASIAVGVSYFVATFVAGRQRKMNQHGA